MNTVRYFKKPRKDGFVGRWEATSIYNAIAIVQEQLDLWQAVVFILEPGDMTKYEFLIARTISNEYYMAKVEGCNPWAIKIDPDIPLHPGYIASHGTGVKDSSTLLWSCSLASEILNLLQDVCYDKHYYDFDRGILIDPNAKKEENTDA